MDQSDLATLEAMMRHMDLLDDDLRPSSFWRTIGERNRVLLVRYGVENFKRTVNQNYFNWLPTDPNDNQCRRLEAYFGEHPDPKALEVELGDWEFLSVVHPGVNPFSYPENRQLYRRFLGLLWHFVSCNGGKPLLESLAEPMLGNPIRATLRGHLISQDLANSVRERATILDSFPWQSSGKRRPVVGELGAGYGRVAFVFLATLPVRYIIIDIAPTLFVAQWYLSRLFPDRKIFSFRPFDDFSQVADAIDDCDIVFLTPDQLFLMPDNYLDIFVTISSLAEMTPEQIAQYLGLISCKTRSRAYIKQWCEWKNPFDHTTIRQDDYEMPPGWRKRLARLDAVHDGFFEAVWERE